MTVYCNTRHLCSTYMGEGAGSRQKCKNLNSTIIFRPIYMQNVFGGTTVHEIYRFVIFFMSFASITWPYMRNSYKLTASLSSSAVIVTPYFYFYFATLRFNIPILFRVKGKYLHIVKADPYVNDRWSGVPKLWFFCGFILNTIQSISNISK